MLGFEIISQHFFVKGRKKHKNSEKYEKFFDCVLTNPFEKNYNIFKNILILISMVVRNKNIDHRSTAENAG